MTTTEQHAVDNLDAFLADLIAAGATATIAVRHDPGDTDTHYGFQLHTEQGHVVDLAILGTPLEQVRIPELTDDGVPALYVDGTPHSWAAAVIAATHPEDCDCS